MNLKTYYIESFSMGALLKKSGENDFWLDPSLPFGRIKLQQYLANPHADEDDVLWLFARSDQGIIGYLGMVPDFVWLQGHRQKINWLSSWWVHPVYRGKGLSDELIQKAFELNEYIAINSGTLISFGKMQKYYEMKSYTQRARCFYLNNLNAAILKDTGHLNPLVKSLLPLGQFGLGALYKLKLSFWLKGRKACQLKIDYLNRLDSESLSFLQEHWPQDFVIHNRESFEWRSNNLIYAPRLKGIQTVRKTYFGNLGFSHQTFNLKLLHEGEMIGYVSLVISDKVLKLPYFYLKSAYAEQFMTLLGNLVLHNGIQAIYSQLPAFNALMQQQGFPRFYTKSYQMSVLISPALAKLERGKVVQDGDGAF